MEAITVRMNWQNIFIPSAGITYAIYQIVISWIMFTFI